jgi:hypothetical protein
VNKYVGPKNNKQECKDYTSKCVIWDGPAIKAPCINVELCRGDNVEQSIFQTYRKLCEVLQAINIEGLDIECLIDVAGSAPSIVDVFNYISDRLCQIQDQLDKYGIVDLDITADLPYCFQYEVNGSVVTKIEISAYYELIAARICGLFISLNDIDNRFDVVAIEAELDLIDAEIQSICNQGPILVTPTCTNDPVLNPAVDPVEIQIAYEWLEKAFCSFRNFTGSVTDIKTAITYDCPDLGNTPKLYGTGVMSDYYGWIDSPSTLADSINNLWITICDTRNGIRKVLDSCCLTGCSSISVGYELIMNNPTGIQLYFPSWTTVTTYPYYLYTSIGVTLNVGFVGTTYQFEDPSATFVAMSLVGYKVKIVQGTGIQQEATIIWNDSTQIRVQTLGTNWISALDFTSIYEVYGVYNGTVATQPAWVATQFPYITNLIVTLNDGSSDYVIDTGNTLFYWLLSTNPPGGTLDIPYPTGYNSSSSFQTINLSFEYKFNNPDHPGDTDCDTCECCCTVNLTNGIY